MLELFLFAFLIGGMPTSGYYLFQYGRKLFRKGRELATADRSLQWRLELTFSVACCVWATCGLLLTHVLKKMSGME